MMVTFCSALLPSEYQCWELSPLQMSPNSLSRRGYRPTSAFFGTKLARQLVNENRKADLVVANNVLAHVPDINDFVAGIHCLLKPDGVATLEFPHIERLIAEHQFDTIYHEHFSYLSALIVERIARMHGLRLFDVEVLSTHGGSLRAFSHTKPR